LRSLKLTGDLMKLAGTMTAKPIPDGYRAVTPYLFVESAERLLTFVTQAFGATETLRVPRSDGSIMHAEVRIGDCPIMIGDVTGPAAQFGPMPSSIYLYVPDCDAVYQQAIAAGGVSVKEVQDIAFNGERYGGVRDPVGNIWWIATHVRDVTME
jgi:PhnB protein